MHSKKALALYCLGYGVTYPIALEGALELKEITYAHCEGMLSTEFKHELLSAVSKGFPIILIVAPNDVPLIIGEEDARLRANGDETWSSFQNRMRRSASCREPCRCSCSRIT